MPTSRSLIRECARGLGVLLLLAGAGCGGGWHRVAAPPPAPVSGSAAAIKVDESRSDPETERRVEAHARYAAGVVRTERGESVQAEQEFARSVAADPGNEALVLELARRYLQEQQADRAIEILSRTTIRPDAGGLMFAWLGMAQAQAGRTNAAIGSFRTAIKKTPQSLMAYHGLAELYLKGHQTNEALRVLDGAANQKDVAPGFLIGLSEFLVVAQRTRLLPADQTKPRILNWLERVARANPTQPFLLQKMADAYKEVGELGRAAKLYEDLLARQGAANPGLALLLREQLVRLYLADGQKAKAADQLKAILRDRPTDAKVYQLLGAIAADSQHYAEAAEAYEKALLMDEDLDTAYFDLAGMRLALGKPTEALAILDKARAKFGASFLVEFYTGVARSGLREYGEAVKNFTAAELLAKANEPARLNHVFYFQIGSAYERLANAAFAERREADGQRYFAEAETHLRRAIELSPDSAEALNYLGYMWAERGTNLGEARQMIEKALKREPDSAAYLDSLAWVLHQSKQSAAALEPMLRAVKLSEEPDATLYEHLGDIYQGLGRRTEARESWQKALDLWQKLPEARRQLISPDPAPGLRRKLEAAP